MTWKHALTLTIPGDAEPWRAPKFVRATGRTYKPSKTRHYQARVAAEAGRRWKEPAHRDAPVKLVIRVYRLRPKSCPRYKTLPTTKPDLTNVTKAVEDALQGILFHNDAQVVEKHESKHFGDQARLEVEVWLGNWKLKPRKGRAIA